MKRKHYLFILSAVVISLLFLKFLIGNNAEALTAQGHKKTEVLPTQVKHSKKFVTDLTSKPLIDIKLKPETQPTTTLTEALADNQSLAKDTFCNDFVTNNGTFMDFLRRVQANSSFCGTGLPVSVIKACTIRPDKTSESACFQVFMKFVSLLTKDQTFDQPQNINDKTLKTQIAKLLFSGEGFQEGGTEKIIPLLNEMLRRHPDNVGLLRIFTMLRATSLLLESLSEYDKKILNLAISQDSENISTRNAIVTIYTRQEEGYEMISRMAYAYPNDIYPYATLVGRLLLDQDRQTALKWAQFGLTKNPNNKQFLSLKHDIENGTFHINKYYNFNFDIAGAFDDILLQ